MINPHQHKQRKRWTFNIQFPDIEIPTSLIKLHQRPTLELQEEKTKDGAWQAQLNLSRWLPVRVTFLPPEHKDLLNILFELWQGRDDPALRGTSHLQMWNNYGKCLEKLTLKNARISNLNEVSYQKDNEITIEIAYDSALFTYT